MLPCTLADPSPGHACLPAFVAARRPVPPNPPPRGRITYTHNNNIWGTRSKTLISEVKVAGNACLLPLDQSAKRPPWVINNPAVPNMGVALFQCEWVPPQDAVSENCCQ